MTDHSELIARAAALDHHPDAFGLHPRSPVCVLVRDLTAAVTGLAKDADRWRHTRLCALPDPTEQFVAGFSLTKQPGIDGEMSDAAVDAAMAAAIDTISSTQGNLK